MLLLCMQALVLIQLFIVLFRLATSFGLRRLQFFFYLLSELLILIFSVVILYAHWVSGNEIKGGESSENAKKKTIFQFSNSLSGV